MRSKKYGKTLKLALFISGKGSNLRAIHEAIETGKLEAQISLVISSDENAQGYIWARNVNIPSVVLKRENSQKREEFVQTMLDLLENFEIDLVVLAGYIKKIPKEVVKRYRNRIINIHPALLPYFGGKGYYGINVHKAVLESGMPYSGVSIHFVDENYDTGPIIIQVPVKINAKETPESLRDRISNVEHQLYYKIIRLFTNENILRHLTKPKNRLM